MPTTTAAPPSNRDITIGPCTWAIDRKCPDNDITFYLYTRKNPTDRQYLYIDENLSSSNLSNSYYDSKHPSKIIIHGYNSDMFLHPLQMMKMEYLAKGDYNIFYVDWSKLSPGPCYMSAVHNTKHAGACVAQLVERILDLGSSDIHVIGFSLGAQLTNYIAKNLGTFQLPRITGLDPAMPLFATASERDKLDASDAAYVDVIHTNAMVQGKLERCGHADFYMNGGIVQPGCAKNNPLNPFACSHQRATAYFLESIRSPKGFWGWACSSYIAYLLGMCPPTNYLVEAGENIKRTTRGMFLINTNDTSPFALGKWTDLPTLGVKKSPNASGLSMTFRPPPQKGDPLLRNIDEWAKLDYNFNYLNHQEPTPFSQDPYGENWTYFSEDTSDITNNSVEELDMTEYQNGHIKHGGHSSTQYPQYEWQEYRRNLTEGFIDNTIFRIPEVGRK
ncbi:pancreatic lipase-related protein 2 isoform 2-T4 [Cochliomyia hominivorax]